MYDEVCIRKWSRESGLNRRPVDYESTALPLSYLGPFINDSIRAKFLSIERRKRSSIRSWRARPVAALAGYREKGYIAQPIPTPISKKRKSDHRMYLTRSLVRRRLKNPNAIEISRAKRTIA